MINIEILIFSLRLGYFKTKEVYQCPPLAYQLRFTTAVLRKLFDTVLGQTKIKTDISYNI